MGYATILGGGTDGRYIIALDWGLSTKSAILASLSALRSQLDIRIGQAQAKVEAVNARAATLAARIETEILSIIERQNTLPPGSPGLQDNDAILRQLYEQRRALGLERQPLLSNVNALTFQRQQADRDIAYWNNVSGNETRQAWCTDLTEDAAIGTLVATMDIPGDSSLIVLAPGCRGWQPSDGQFRARELCSPEQAFFNAAIAPGWAKFLPTYRWGTIMGLNYEADTATVSLATATMTGQALNVNQSNTLTNIPVVYMTCNARAFELGDRVVVQFVGQDWAAARVVGFVDNPRPCVELPDVVIPLQFKITQSAAGGYLRDWISTQFASTCGDSGTASIVADGAGLEASAVWDDSISFTEHAAEFASTPPPPRTSGGDAIINYTPPAPITVGETTFRGIPNTVQVPAGATPGILHEPATVSGYSFAVRRRTYPFADVTITQYTIEPNDSPPPDFICIPDPPKTAPYFTLQPWGVDQFNSGGNAHTVDYRFGPAQLETFVAAQLGALPAVSVTYDGREYEFECVGAGSGPGTWNLIYRQVT